MQERRGKRSVVRSGRERWQWGGNEDIFQEEGGETLQSQSLRKY